MDKINRCEYKITCFFLVTAIIEFKPGLGVGVTFGMQWVLNLVSKRRAFQKFIAYPRDDPCR